MTDYMDLLEKPFLKSKEIAKLLDCSLSTVSKMVKKHDFTHYPWGYSTDEIIQKLNLQRYIKRCNKKTHLGQ